MYFHIVLPNYGSTKWSLLGLRDRVVVDAAASSARGGGVHDLRIDGGLPPSFQKATL